ncbi:hypothetical protein EVAR_91641_1 [Eumeta japonica]|uniref:Uncharacterized protein n=1 Tax=Eumeta variegata TaxID=151549 RepID=A0A4C1ZZW6_EUMVA|nr:hypothetical protein EVAR_91641_1 [Eumeta japonica]
MTYEVGRKLAARKLQLSSLTWRNQEKDVFKMVTASVSSARAAALAHDRDKESPPAPAPRGPVTPIRALWVTGSLRNTARGSHSHLFRSLMYRVLSAAQRGGVTLDSMSKTPRAPAPARAAASRL